MIEVRESMGLNSAAKVIATFETYAEAESFVMGKNPACFEADEEYNDCADAYMQDGRVISIQPANLKVKKWL